MADFISQLNGTQMDTALMGVARHDPEAWAVGQRNGQNVSSTDETYENNAKYYADRAKTDLTDSVEAAEDAAARAEAAVPAGTAGAVFFDRAQSLTAAQKLQARANIAAGASNRNLLDNPWFGSGEVVNQRGVTTKPSSNNVYTIDRWLFSSGADANNWSVGSSGIAFTISASSIWFSENLANVAALFGKTLTASVLLSNGTVKSGTATITSSASATFINDSALTVTLNTAGTFQLAVKTTQTIRAVKLELGSYSTLINDTPPDYGEEFRKCARYFFRAKGDPLAFGYIAGTKTEAYVGVITAAPMRAQPSVAVSGSVSVRVQGYTHGVSSITSISNPISTGCSVGLKMNLSETASAIGACVVYPNANSYIDLSADL